MRTFLRTGSRVPQLIKRKPGQKQKNGTRNPAEQRSGNSRSTTHAKAEHQSHQTNLVIGFITKEYQCIAIQVYNIV